MSWPCINPDCNLDRGHFPLPCNEPEARTVFVPAPITDDFDW